METLETNILMVGPRGVGKTSLVAAMAETMELIADNLGGVFLPTVKTANVLEKKRSELKTAVDLADGFFSAPEKGIPGGLERIDYEFDVKVDGAKKGSPDFRMRLVDVPGGWYTDHPDKLADLFSIAQMSFVVVDSTALLESRTSKNPTGRYHETVNSPGFVSDFYKHVLNDNGHHRHVIFVLGRAESYMGDKGAIGLSTKSAKQTQEKMVEALVASYQRLLEVLDKNGVTYSACAISTMGGIRFHKFDLVSNLAEKSMYPVATFAVDRKVRYKPEFCDVPLREALAFAAKRAAGQSSMWEDFIKMLPIPQIFKDVPLRRLLELEVFAKRLSEGANRKWSFELRSETSSKP